MVDFKLRHYRILYQSVARPGLATGCDKAACTTASKSARLQVEFLDEDEHSIRLKAPVAEMQAMVEATLDFARGAAVQEAAVQVDLAAVRADLVSDAAAGEGHATLAAAQPVLAAVHLTTLKRALRCRRMAAMSPCATAPKADWRRWCACRLIRLIPTALAPDSLGIPKAGDL